jgi:hypothetical protein
VPSFDKKERIEMQALQKTWVSRNTGASLVMLSHVGVHGDTQEVARYGGSETQDANRLHEDIMRDATNFAAGLGGMQRFLAAAYGDGDEGRVLLSSITFPIHAVSQQDDESSMLSEPPNTVGLVAQLMRHLEVMHRSHTAQNAALVEQLAMTVRELRRENDHLRSERTKTLEATESILTQKHLRDLATQKEASSSKFKQEMWNDLMPYVNAAISKITGPTFMRPVSSDLELSAKAVAQALKLGEMDVLSNDPRFSSSFKLALSTLLTTVLQSDMVTPAEKQADDEDARRLSVAEKPLRGAQG